MISFVENKMANMPHISALLELCRSENQWANCGPLYRKLSQAYAVHFGLGQESTVTPCSNAGIALEAMSRLLCQKAGRKLRWVGSAFSFQNLGRGHFADMQFVDCTESGLLDLDAVEALDPDSFDGIIVVNPFGIFRDFDAYISFARRTGKQLLFDNAAGIDTVIPDWPWQAFSLHHTKPYGAGEGGLAVTPAEEAAPFYSLLNYGPAPGNAADWLNNGKISDISCAFLLDRLASVDDWRPMYLAQACRVATIAAEFDLRPLRDFGETAPAMSWPFVSPKPISLERVMSASHLTFGKYYKPLADFPRTRKLFDHLVNIPTHPDMARLSDADLRRAIESVLD